MSDGGIGRCKYRHRRPPFSVVEDVFDCGGAPSLSDHGCRCRGLVVSLPLLLLRGGALLDLNGNNNEDKDKDKDKDKGDDDRSCQDSVMGMRALRWGTSPITTTPMLRCPQAGLRRTSTTRRRRRRAKRWKDNAAPNPGGKEPRAAVVFAVDAAENVSSLSSSGSGATTEETNRQDGGGRGKKRRRRQR